MKEKLLYSESYNELSEKETALLQDALISVRRWVRRSKTLNPKGYATRGAHATTYSILEGTFTPSENGRELFPSESYDCLLRLSHPHLKLVSQKRGLPVFGLSVKILQTSGTVLNLPLVNFPLFPMVEVKGFLNLFIALNAYFTQGLFGKLRNGLKILGAFGQIISASFNASFLQQVLELIRTSKRFCLDFDFHSVGACRFGNHMVKYKFVPTSRRGRLLERVDRSIGAYMASGKGYEGELFVQFAYNLENQPINFLNRLWRNSPWVSVGLIQCYGLLDAKDPEIEALSFNPFESKEALQPVGKIQKLREEVYQASFNEREKSNQNLRSNG